ncbi:hypothetical protein R1flu_003533 [Riccia fluitans]|uniref:Uncharacterized protein n=1 Tax=Riccia fluitans TaxID=41844 RepID=A0ABD1Y9E3_9MARC
MDDIIVGGLLYLAEKRFEHHIKDALKDEDELKIEEFKKLMHDFNQRCIDFPALNQQITTLFRDYPDLREEFTTFYPEYDTEYIDFVKETLVDEDDLLPEFWKLLEEYRTRVLDIKGFTVGLSLIFEHHLELVDGLYYFLPVEALGFADSVRDYFADKEEEEQLEGGYEVFVRLLDELRANGGEFAEVRMQFVELLHNDYDLIQGFNRFLPEHERIEYIELEDGEILSAAAGTNGVDVGEEKEYDDEEEEEDRQEDKNLLLKVNRLQMKRF